MKITLYIIKGLSTEKHYIGITNDLQRRLQEHRSGSSKGGQVIGDFELVHSEEFSDYSSAREREISEKWARTKMDKREPY